MKKILRAVYARILMPLLDLSYYLCFFLARPKSAENKRSVLVLQAADGWEGGDGYSFGDEMLMLGLVEGLQRKGLENIAVLSAAVTKDREVVVHGHRVRIIGFTRGWLSPGSYWQLAAMARNFSHFVVIGADVLDAAYSTINSTQRLRFLTLMGKCGLKTVVTGFSFNGTDIREVRRLFQKAEQLGAAICAREEVTKSRLDVFLKKPILCADLAFEVNAERYPRTDRVNSIVKRADDFRKKGGLVIGVNLCGWHIKDSGLFFSQLIESLSKFGPAGKKVGLILIPHDTREDICSDLSTLQALSKHNRGRLEIIGEPEDIKSGIDAKQVVASCDILLTGRMHLAIAALHQAVPAISFSYQKKFEGLYDLFGLSHTWLVSYEAPVAAVQVLYTAIQNLADTKNKIALARDKVVSLADKNFDAL